MGEQVIPMLRSLKELESYTVRALDGDVGKVVNFLFDDERWAIRYLVVQTGGFFQERQVLISPISFREVDWSMQRFQLGLTKDKIKHSPRVDADRPVSRQHERDYYQFYGYPCYWGSMGVGGMGYQPSLLGSGRARDALPEHSDEEAGDAHLRSVKEVCGYHVQGSDEAIGFIADFIVDDETWDVRYLVIDTGHWWWGHKVLVAPRWASRISWEQKKVFVNLSRDASRMARHGTRHRPSVANTRRDFTTITGSLDTGASRRRRRNLSITRKPGLKRHAVASRRLPGTTLASGHWKGGPGRASVLARCRGPDRKSMRKSTSFAALLFVPIVAVGAICAYLLYASRAYVGSVAVVVAALTIASLVSAAVNVADQWDRAVVLRLGKFHALRGPGLFFIVPIVDAIPYWIDTRTITASFKAERTLTKDTVPVDVEAVLFWRVLDPKKAALDVADYRGAISWASQTALRDVIGKTVLSDMLEGRDKISRELQKIIDERTEPWGINVISVEVKDVLIPQALENAMSMQAQADRERQARVILGDSERQVADSFGEAAKTYKDNPIAFHLRAMNMLYEGLKQNSTIVVVPSSAVESMQLGGLAGLTALTLGLQDRAGAAANGEVAANGDGGALHRSG